jgi:response regulator RpfG family c-di-GMP phosphodiesterase
MTTVLGDQGYTLVEARNAEEAISLATSYAEPIQLLLTDLVMTGMNGRELASQLCHMRPDMETLYVSGYTKDIIARHGVLNEGITFLEKPFTPVALAHKVREVLDE